MLQYLRRIELAGTGPTNSNLHILLQNVKVKCSQKMLKGKEPVGVNHRILKRVLSVTKMKNIVICMKSARSANGNIQAMVNGLQDARLLAKVVGCDLIAIEAKYHLKCLTKLRNKCRSPSYIRRSKNDEAETEEKMTGCL